jgi:hypothetical protein
MNVRFGIIFFLNVFCHNTDINEENLPSFADWLRKINEAKVYSQNIILKLESKDHKTLEMSHSHPLFRKFDFVEKFKTNKLLLRGSIIVVPFSFNVINNLILISHNDHLESFTAYALDHVDEYTPEFLHQILQGIFYFGLNESIEWQNTYKKNSSYSSIHLVINNIMDPSQKIKQLLSIKIIKLIPTWFPPQKYNENDCGENLFYENAPLLINKIFEFLTDNSCDESQSSFDKLDTSKQLIIKYGLRKLDRFQFYKNLKKIKHVNPPYLNGIRYGGTILRAGFNW